MSIRCYLVETLQNGTLNIHDIHIMHQIFKHTTYPLRHFNIESLLEVLEAQRLKRYVENHNYKLYIDIVYEIDNDSVEYRKYEFEKKAIYNIKDILELAEKLKSSNPEQKVIFVDSDYNQYFIKKDVKLGVIGESLDLDRYTMEENGSNYDEDCIVLEVL